MSLKSELERKIRESSQKYYTDGTSDMTDAEFDSALAELKEIDPRNSLVNSVGHGYSVDQDTTYGQKKKHKYGVAGSLPKCHNWKEISGVLKESLEKAEAADWLNDITARMKNSLTLSLKLDGLSCVLYYKKGKLVEALTRGDGTTGIVITDKVKMCLSDVSKDFTLNKHLETPCTFTGAIRGEIIMPIDVYDEYKEENSDAKNARNVAAGLINAKTISPWVSKLALIPYNVVGYEKSEDIYDGVTYDFHYIEDHFSFISNFFSYPYQTPHQTVFSLPKTDEGLIDALSKLFDSAKEFIKSDGIVINHPCCTIDENGYVQPVDAQAFKFKSSTANATVEEVEWSLTKTRYLMPRVRITPVELEDTIVQYCTGYNAQYIRDNKIGPGAIVEVEKRGDIIPNINKVIEPGQCVIPSSCPDCGHDLVWNGVHLQCVNDDCKNASLQDLNIWIENLAPVEGFKEKLRTKMLQEIFGERLTIEDVMSASNMSIRFGRSGHKKLLSDMFEKLYTRTNIPPATALKALNIPRIGDKTAESLAQHPGLIIDLLDNLKAGMGRLSPERTEYMMTSAIGCANTVSVFDNLDKVKRLLLIYDRICWDTEPVAVTNKGKVAITGKLSMKRSDFETELKAAGYTVGDISKSTNFLITDDPTSSSSKNKKADQWGIVKITEAEFRKKYL